MTRARGSAGWILAGAAGAMLAGLSVAARAAVRGQLTLDVGVGRSCFAGLEAGVECGPQGTLESLTVGLVGIDGEPLDTPVALGLVKLDGATTVFLHRLTGVETPAIGMRVRAVLRDARTASIDDIEGFAPVQD